jgi:signal transduction histidine kinase/CheY-like chemotaxis protein
MADRDSFAKTRGRNPSSLFPARPRFSPKDEERYRAEFLQIDELQAGMGMAVFLVAFVISAVNDYAFLGLSTRFYLLEALRFVAVISSIFFIIFVRRVKGHVQFDRIVIGWQILGLLTVVLINLSRPPDYSMFVVADVIVVAALYIVFRSHFIFQTLLALALTAADLSIIILTKHLPHPELRAIVASYILANGLGITVLWLINIARRREFLARDQEAASLKETHRLEVEKFKQSRLESIGVLAGGIAHDFNNALTGIIGNIDLASSALCEDKQEEAGQRLKDALSASERAKNMSMQLLTFAKGGVPEMKTVSLPELIKETITFSLQGSNIAPKINIGENLWPVEGDSGQLSQVFSNLLINARQAMNAGGRIKISASNVDPGAAVGTRAGKFVLIQVEDNGPGIPGENLDHIFDPFFTTKESGHGLGLAVADSIVKKHGGFIEVQSRVGAGTRFDVYLPASDRTPEKTKNRRPAASYRRSGRILVMDDDEVIRKLVMHSVQLAGYTVSAAADGAGAVDIYRKGMENGEPYDAVILDLTVPGGMGGKEAITELKKLDPNVRAIASSGYSDDAVMANFRQFGFKESLPKPYSISALLSVLEKAAPGEKG